MNHPLSQLSEHKLRATLTEEVHARPYEIMPPPARASFVAMCSGEAGGEVDWQAVCDLCERFSVEPPAAGAVHFTADLGPFRVCWERHTEFSTYGFIQRAPFDHPFDDPVIDRVPAEWLQQLPGEALVAIHVAVEDRRAGERDLSELADLFSGNTVAGSVVAGGTAKAWTDFRIHDDGFSRVLVEDLDMRVRQAGRMVQRLVEIETYRMLALLAFPEARNSGRIISDIGRQHAALTERISQLSGLEDEQDALNELSRLAAEVERIATATNYRFSAAEAYYALVERRIEELREQRVEGVQTFREFMDRRLSPGAITESGV